MAGTVFKPYPPPPSPRPYADDWRQQEPAPYDVYPPIITQPYAPAPVGPPEPARRRRGELWLLVVSSLVLLAVGAAMFLLLLSFVRDAVPP